MPPVNQYSNTYFTHIFSAIIIFRFSVSKQHKQYTPRQQPFKTTLLKDNLKLILNLNRYFTYNQASDKMQWLFRVERYLGTVLYCCHHLRCLYLRRLRTLLNIVAGHHCTGSIFKNYDVYGISRASYIWKMVYYHKPIYPKSIQAS